MALIFSRSYTTYMKMRYKVASLCSLVGQCEADAKYIRGKMVRGGVCHGDKNDRIGCEMR